MNEGCVECPHPDYCAGMEECDKNKPPVRLCCGLRHWGAVCPDGKVMCQLCFNRFEVEDLHTTKDGKKEDVCNECAKTEAQMQSG